MRLSYECQRSATGNILHLSTTIGGELPHFKLPEYRVHDPIRRGRVLGRWQQQWFGLIKFTGILPDLALMQDQVAAAGFCLGITIVGYRRHILDDDNFSTPANKILIDPLVRFKTLYNDNPGNLVLRYECLKDASPRIIIDAHLTTINCTPTYYKRGRKAMSRRGCDAAKANHST